MNLIDIVDNDKIVECYFNFNKEKKLLARIDREKQRTEIYPLYTRIGLSHFLEPKYSVNFIFEGYDIDVETRIVNEVTNEEIHVLSEFPQIFISTLEHGLGIKKEYRFILHTASEVKNCKSIIISKTRETGLDGTNIVITARDLDKIRRGLDRTTALYQKEALVNKTVFIFNELLHNIDKTQFPKKKRTIKREIIYRIVKDMDFSKSISDSDKSSLLELKYGADFSYFSSIKTDFDKKIEENKGESDFQKFFERNVLLLTLFSGAPYVFLKEQAYCGGKSLDNKKGQYTDFLYKNNLTNNCFIIEIKCPKTLLLESKPYRETGVYSSSKELSGAVSQVLTQKYQLETHITSLKQYSDDQNIEAHNVQCLVIIGLLKNLNGENEKDKKRSFELFRNNQKNVRIITYDECQEYLDVFIDASKNNMDKIQERIT